MNYFAFFDPAEPEHRQDPLKAFLALIFAFLAQFIVGWLFKYSLRLAPTLLGVYTGYYLSIYLIVATNGISGAFSSAKVAHDAIDPVMSMVYEGIGALVGGLIGYNYSYLFIITMQCFISAYFIVRGTTLFYNAGFPNEIVLLNSSTSQENGLMQLPPAFYAYSLLILVLWFIFLRNQYRKAWSDEAIKER